MSISWLPEKHPFYDATPQSEIEDYVLDMIKKIEEEEIYFNGKRVYLMKYAGEIELTRESLTFSHLMKRKNSAGVRVLDLYRCMRINWIIPVINNAYSPEVYIYEEYSTKIMKNLVHLFIEEKRYVVILVKKPDFYLLQTAYYIDQNDLFNFYRAMKRKSAT